jgi:hypothetical protein
MSALHLIWLASVAGAAVGAYLRLRARPAPPREEKLVAMPLAADAPPDAATVAAEAAPLGWDARTPLAVAPTEDYVGSEVVVLCRR